MSLKPAASISAKQTEGRVTAKTIKSRSRAAPKLSSPSFLEAKEDFEVKLDVGGRVFRVRRNTLLRSEGFLASLVSGRWSRARGQIFLDRDGQAFGGVLSYLRNTEAFVPPPPGPERRSLYEEARYFACRSSSRSLGLCIRRVWKGSWPRGGAKPGMSLGGGVTRREA